MDETKKCPMCGETIKAEARLCRYCWARYSFKQEPVPRKERVPVLTGSYTQTLANPTVTFSPSNSSLAWGESGTGGVKFSSTASVSAVT
jgi:Double zinc ribbon domain